MNLWTSPSAPKGRRDDIVFNPGKYGEEMPADSAD